MNMTVLIAQNIITDFDKNFDSHRFIRELLKNYPSVYAKLLLKYNDVGRANAEIANFLRNHAVEIGITELPEQSLSVDLFLVNTLNASWQKK